jgi:uncharacterized protein involved in exopolysaccharide biosynthesis
MALRLAVTALVAAVTAGCSGQTCDELPSLREERDQARAAYLELAQSGGASPAETEQADAELHALERRVFEIEQDCAGR